jgi:predicted enzyme related to lactoylglutathione lyase
MFSWGTKSMGGIYNKPADVPQAHWLSYAMVPDTDKAVEKVKRAGGKIVNGPMEVPGGDRIAVGVDPQGAAFALHSAKPAETAKATASAAPAKAGKR